MSDTLKDQLMGLGFKPAPKHEKPVRPSHPKDAERTHRPSQGKPTSRPSRAKGGERRDARPVRSQEEIDLAKAYALRAASEKRERENAEKAKQELARQRREAKAKLDALLVGKALNDPAAEVARHFPYGGKIKRVYVTPEQLKALNAGELGVLQSNGRYLLVSAALLVEAKSIFAEAVALEVDPNAPAGSDEYADPSYQVPDDLVW